MWAPNTGTAHPAYVCRMGTICTTRASARLSLEGRQGPNGRDDRQRESESWKESIAGLGGNVLPVHAFAWANGKALHRFAQHGGVACTVVGIHLLLERGDREVASRPEREGVLAQFAS